MIEGKKVFVVQAGEEFEIHIAGPVQNLADPTGIVGGSTFEYTACNDRSNLVRTAAYSISVKPGQRFLERTRIA
jgi:hypothetical protein